MNTITVVLVVAGLAVVAIAAYVLMNNDSGMPLPQEAQDGVQPMTRGDRALQYTSSFTELIGAGFTSFAGSRQRDASEQMLPALKTSSPTTSK